MIWLDRDPVPVLRCRVPDVNVEHAWPVHPDAVTVHDLAIPLEPDSGTVHMSRIRRVVVAFESGWSASVIWGSGTYSDNRDAWRTTDAFTETPNRVEVGVLHHDALVGEPLGYVDAATLAVLLDAMRVADPESEMVIRTLAELGAG